MTTNVLKQADILKAKECAEGLIAKYGLEKPPINSIDIARDMGVEVYFGSFPKEGSNISGFYDAEEDAIYVNQDESPLRQMFTVAHELGHRILHKEWAASNDYRYLLHNDDFDHEPHEIEANAFASNLLMPRFLLDRYYDETISIQDMSKLFVASIPHVHNRLKMAYGI